ncbi:hypothetical protein D047_3192A, partial [Vibrio parahaemolyticus VPTS-2010_2]
MYSVVYWLEAKL